VLLTIQHYSDLMVMKPHQELMAAGLLVVVHHGLLTFFRLALVI
jgi:hypothetical protein